ERGDMRAVDIGVGHDDDALVAQLLLLVALAGAAAERLDEVGDLLVGAHLLGRRAGDVEDLAFQGQDRLRLAVARLLRRAAGAVTLDEEDLGALGGAARAVGELAREAQLARRRFAQEVLFLPAPRALLGALYDALDERFGGDRVAREPMVE